MKTQRFLITLLIALTLANLALLIFTLVQRRPLVAEGIQPVLRGRALQIVDERGEVRASIQVPDGAEKTMQRKPEDQASQAEKRQPDPPMWRGETTQGNEANFPYIGPIRLRLD